MKVSVDVTLPENLQFQKQTMIDLVKNSREVENTKITETKDGFKAEGSTNGKALGADKDFSYDDIKELFKTTGYKCK